MIDYFEKEVIDLLQCHLGLSPRELKAVITAPSNWEHGDLALPCFAWASAHKSSPQNLAKSWYEKLSSCDLPPDVWKVEAVGPYLNFYADRRLMAQRVLREIEQRKQDYGRAALHGKTVVVEFSSPNIAKPFSIGHLRSTNLGACLARVFEMRGWKVIKVNHLGDWGTQFGKVMLAYRLWGKAEDLDKHPLDTLYALYVKFHTEEETQPKLIEEARQWFARLEQGDAEAVELWQWFKDLSVKEIRRIYQDLGIEFDHYWGESFYVERLPQLFADLEQRGLSQLSEDALIVDLKGFNLGVSVIKKQDESSLYISRDIAAAMYRYENLSFDRMLYVVGTPQLLHFAQLFKILQLMDCSWFERCEHINFGHVSFGKEGMSTRKGNVLFLADVIAKAEELALQVVSEKNPNLANKEQVAHAVALGAVLFADVSARRIKDVKFSWEDILNFDGETGPYLQYSLVRTKSLLRKAGTTDFSDVDFSLLRSKEEVEVLRYLASYPKLLERAENEREPFVVADYLLDLAQSFNRFYTHHRILDAEALQAKARLMLVFGVSQSLENGLRLLGIPILQEM